MGAATLAVLWSEAGDPVAYSSAGADVKALGLNLKERSSGQRNGQLAISKRGPAMSRRWLFFWALRASHQRRAASSPQASPQGWEKGGVTKKPSKTFS